jgi:hypothetical protein
MQRFLLRLAFSDGLKMLKSTKSTGRRGDNIGPYYD